MAQTTPDARTEPPGPGVLTGTAATPSPYAGFGDAFVRRILHAERVCRSVDQVLGPRLTLGPIGAGPGRVLARITADARFHPTSAVEVPADVLTYRVALPVSVDFALDLRADVHRFHADVLLPLALSVHVEAPLTLVWVIEPPAEHEVDIAVATDKRRSAVLQRVSGLDSELRRFLVRVVAKELTKPHVVRATRIDMLEVIDGAWPAIASQFLPQR